MTIKKPDKKILIIDENGFSRICSAILTSCGYHTDVASPELDLPKKLNSDPVDLVVTSYPYGRSIFESLRNKDIPIIILSDGIDERLMGILGHFQNSCCMIKPVDYDKFKSIVKQAVETSSLTERGYSIV